MGRRIGEQFHCEFCSLILFATGNNQRTCNSRTCKLKLRSVVRKAIRRQIRAKSPAKCVWCKESITEEGKRKYHAACRTQKNRKRVKEYNRTHKPSIGFKKQRVYESVVECVICGDHVRRTSARQVTCATDVCKYIRKRALDTTRRAERTKMSREAMIAEIRAEKERRFHNRQPRNQVLPAIFRTRI